MIGDLRAHIETKIAEAELCRYPFPHVIVENFFPDAIYRKILDDNPFKDNPGREWFPPHRAPSRTPTPYWARKQLNFRTDWPFTTAGEGRRFWEGIRECFLMDHWFARVVFDKYKEYFVIRFGEIVESNDFFGLFKKELFLQRHEPGYSLGPHTDVPTRVFTCIFSFADRPGFDEYGTQLCVHANPRVRCWGNNHYPPDDFVVRKIAPYRPNSFLLFFKTRQSFHSVKPIDATVPNQRYGMQFQLYEPPRGALIDLSEPDLMVAKLRSGLRAKLKEVWSVLRK